MSDLVQRLRGLYPVGAILETGEPEFGWRQFDGTPAIQLEAADRIEALEAVVAQAGFARKDNEK